MKTKMIDIIPEYDTISDDDLFLINEDAETNQLTDSNNDNANDEKYILMIFKLLVLKIKIAVMIIQKW